jgi:hypothetical protein
LTYKDIDFLADVFERDDITVISQGLLDPDRLEDRLWDMKVFDLCLSENRIVIFYAASESDCFFFFIHAQAIRTCIGYRTHHKFKRFQQTEGEGGRYVEPACLRCRLSSISSTWTGEMLFVGWHRCKKNGDIVAPRAAQLRA